MMLQAATLPKGSVERMLYVCAFAVSGYSGTARRTIKPFNPLLGETFEFVCPEQGMRCLIEKVNTQAHVEPLLPICHFLNFLRCDACPIREANSREA